MNTLKLYLAGKINPSSPLARTNWRDSYCQYLQEKTGMAIINLDPLKSTPDLNLDQSNTQLIFGRNAYMIKIADLVIVNLTDDISIGGSQEMLIAKYYHRPLIGIAPKGGKFNCSVKEIAGKTYYDWLNPYVAVPCDMVIESIEEMAECLHRVIDEKRFVKDIRCISQAINYYLKNYHSQDCYIQIAENTTSSL